MKNKKQRIATSNIQENSNLLIPDNPVLSEYYSAISQFLHQINIVDTSFSFDDSLIEIINDAAKIARQDSNSPTAAALDSNWRSFSNQILFHVQQINQRNQSSKILQCVSAIKEIVSYTNEAAPIAQAAKKEHHNVYILMKKALSHIEQSVSLNDCDRTTLQLRNFKNDLAKGYTKFFQLSQLDRASSITAMQDCKKNVDHILRILAGTNQLYVPPIEFQSFSRFINQLKLKYDVKKASGGNQRSRTPPSRFPKSSYQRNNFTNTLNFSPQETPNFSSTAQKSPDSSLPNHKIRTPKIQTKDLALPPQSKTVQIPNIKQQLRSRTPPSKIPSLTVSNIRSTRLSPTNIPSRKNQITENNYKNNDTIVHQSTRSKPSKLQAPSSLPSSKYRKIISQQQNSSSSFNVNENDQQQEKSSTTSKIPGKRKNDSLSSTLNSTLPATLNDTQKKKQRGDHSRKPSSPTTLLSSTMSNIISQSNKKNLNLSQNLNKKKEQQIDNLISTAVNINRAIADSTSSSSSSSTSENEKSDTNGHHFALQKNMPSFSQDSETDQLVMAVKKAKEEARKLSPTLEKLQRDLSGEMFYMNDSNSNAGLAPPPPPKERAGRRRRRKDECGNEHSKGDSKSRSDQSRSDNKSISIRSDQSKNDNNNSSNRNRNDSSNRSDQSRNNNKNISNRNDDDDRNDQSRNDNNNSSNKSRSDQSRNDNNNSSNRNRSDSSNRSDQSRNSNKNINNRNDDDDRNDQSRNNINKDINNRNDDDRNDQSKNDNNSSKNRNDSNNRNDQNRNNNKNIINRNDDDNRSDQSRNDTNSSNKSINIRNDNNNNKNASIKSDNNKHEWKSSSYIRHDDRNDNSNSACRYDNDNDNGACEDGPDVEIDIDAGEFAGGELGERREARSFDSRQSATVSRYSLSAIEGAYGEFLDRLEQFDSLLEIGDLIEDFTSHVTNEENGGDSDFNYEDELSVIDGKIAELYCSSPGTDGKLTGNEASLTIGRALGALNSSIDEFVMGTANSDSILSEYERIVEMIESMNVSGNSQTDKMFLQAINNYNPIFLDAKQTLLDLVKNKNKKKEKNRSKSKKDSRRKAGNEEELANQNKILEEEIEKLNAELSNLKDKEKLKNNSKKNSIEKDEIDENALNLQFDGNVNEMSCDELAYVQSQLSSQLSEIQKQYDNQIMQLKKVKEKSYKNRNEIRIGLENCSRQISEVHELLHQCSKNKTVEYQSKTVSKDDLQEILMNLISEESQLIQSISNPMP